MRSPIFALGTRRRMHAALGAIGRARRVAGLLAGFAAGLAGGGALAQDVGVQPPDLADFMWVARPIVIFADAPQDPRVAQQLEIFAKRQDELDERDVVVLVDTDPSTLSPLRRDLRPRDFNVVLIGKDGEVKYRKPNPVTVTELIRLIDRMPLRQQELSTQRSTPTN